NGCVERRERGPAAEADEEHQERDHACANFPAAGIFRAFKVSFTYGLAGEKIERHGRTPSFGTAVIGRGPPGLIRAMIASRGPNASMRPSATIISLFTWLRKPVRCATTMLHTPRALASRNALSRAVSPS